jgi:hypothetical protein
LIVDFLLLLIVSFAVMKLFKFNAIPFVSSCSCFLSHWSPISESQRLCLDVEVFSLCFPLVVSKFLYPFKEMQMKTTLKFPPDPSQSRKKNVIKEAGRKGSLFS